MCFHLCSAIVYGILVSWFWDVSVCRILGRPFHWLSKAAFALLIYTVGYLYYSVIQINSKMCPGKADVGGLRFNFFQVCSTRVFSEFQAHRWKSMTLRTVLNEVCYIFFCMFFSIYKKMYIVGCKLLVFLYYIANIAVHSMLSNWKNAKYFQQWSL